MNFEPKYLGFPTLEERNNTILTWMVEQRSTTRKTAAHWGLSKSTIYQIAALYMEHNPRSRLTKRIRKLFDENIAIHGGVPKNR